MFVLLPVCGKTDLSDSLRESAIRRRFVVAPPSSQIPPGVTDPYPRPI